MSALTEEVGSQKDEPDQVREREMKSFHALRLLIALLASIFAIVDEVSAQNRSDDIQGLQKTFRFDLMDDDLALEEVPSLVNSLVGSWTVTNPGWDEDTIAASCERRPTHQISARNDFEVEILAFGKPDGRLSWVRGSQFARSISHSELAYRMDQPIENVVGKLSAWFGFVQVIVQGDAMILISESKVNIFARCFDGD